MRWLYSLFLYLAVPAVWLRLLWRSRRQPEYRQHLGERWGYYRPAVSGRLLWVHAVSVGETRAAQPLVEGLMRAYPEHRILLTCMTPTGREAGASVYGERVIQAYLPYDYPGAVGRFLDYFRPDMGILMETEIWPNLLHGAARRRIPVMLANARLSVRSAAGYQRFSGLVRPAFASLAACAAQTAPDGERLAALGVAMPEVCGNLKFDVAPDPDKLALGKQWRLGVGRRPVWLAASTREGEEARILEAWEAMANPEVLLVLVPRHPQRFGDVRQLIASHGLSCVSRSAAEAGPETRVWLGDSMGEMAAYYAMADLAFIGGSLLPLGGQNLIEAAACGCPVVVGPHTFNFTQATEDAIAAGAAQRVADVASLTEAVRGLLADEQRLAAMRERAGAFAAAHRGACQRTLALVETTTGRWPGRAAR